MFATKSSAFSLFAWLRTTFNGDLFPMDDPGAERQYLNNQHLVLLRDFIEGRSLVPGRRGQSRLFRFRFDAIPVDLISSIYQQFARSAAANRAASQGLHYTPVELVHLTLDPVFEQLGADARVIDPTCGSGAFLVEAFRRLVWRASEGRQADRRLVRKILYNQLFGIDINRSALGIAAFSLYLAAMELDEEPVTDISDLKFDRLINTTLFKADTIADELPSGLKDAKFDAVVGNPPWTFVRRKSEPHNRVRDKASPHRPRRSPDQDFLARATDFAGETGRIGMVMKSTPFFSKDAQAVQARCALLKQAAPVALVNLSFLRKEGLFPDAIGPALLFFARCALTSPPDRMLVGSVPWTADFRRTGMFHIGPTEIRSVSLERVLATPPILKAAAFGTIRDMWLIERLERDFPTLEKLLTSIGINARVDRGQGYKVNGAEQSEVPADYYALPVLTPSTFTPFRLNSQRLEQFGHPTLHRTRTRSIFRGPLLLCLKIGSEASAEPGRYSAAVHDGDVLYTENFYGISFQNVDPAFAYALSAILNSSMTTFQFTFAGPTWGLERPTVQPHDLLSLRVPDLLECDRGLLSSVIAAEQEAAVNGPHPDHLLALDRAVFKLYDLETDECVVAAGSVARARPLIFEGHTERGKMVQPPSPLQLRKYATQVVRSVDAYLRARGERHMEAHVYAQRATRSNPETHYSGVTAAAPGIALVRFVMAPGAPQRSAAPSFTKAIPPISISWCTSYTVALIVPARRI